MSEKREYTAEDYAQAYKVLKDWDCPQGLIGDELLLSALRLAANVMRPGVIADAVDAALNRRDVQIDEAAIRKALLGEVEDAGR